MGELFCCDGEAITIDGAMIVAPHAGQGPFNPVRERGISSTVEHMGQLKRSNMSTGRLGSVSVAPRVISSDDPLTYGPILLISDSLIMAYLINSQS
jgi:hypothetical protein